MRIPNATTAPTRQLNRRPSRTAVQGTEVDVRAGTPIARVTTTTTSYSATLRLLLQVLLLLVVGPRPQGVDALTYPSLSPDFPCPDTIDTLNACLVQNNLNVTSCAECSFSYHDNLTTNGTTTTPSLCYEITDQICELLNACYVYCGTCAMKIQVIETCSWGYECFWSCPTYPWFTTPSNPTPVPTQVPATQQPTPGPVPTPTVAPNALLSPSSPSTPPPFPLPIPSRCADHVTAFSSCVLQTGNLNSCYECFDVNIPDHVSTCEDSRSYICSADEICPTCGQCQDQFEAVINCANEGYCPPFDCVTSSTGMTTQAPVPGPVPTPAVVPSPSPPFPLPTSRAVLVYPSLFVPVGMIAIVFSMSW